MADGPGNKRFATIDDVELRRIMLEKDAKNTRRATETAVRTFRTYLKEKQLNEAFEDLTNEELDKILTKFYPEARTNNGELYKKTTLISLRHGLGRYLSNSDSCRDIIHGSDFRESNRVFTACTKELKRQGKGKVDHHPPIELADLQKLYGYFNLEDRVQLQEKVFVDVMLYFGRRGRENIHELKISDFAATSDSNGHVYIYMTTDELTKNHQEDENTASGRMYSRDDELCPVKSFMKYLKHVRGNKCDRLFQRPSKGTSRWYDSAPMGHNTIGSMMASLSEKAGLSLRYTNHSLRATSVHVLDNIGNFAGRHIMTVTGHKSEGSLKTYTGYTGEQVKRQMSDTISESLRRKINMKDDVANDAPVAKKICEDFPLPDLTNSELKPLSNSQLDKLVEDIQEFDDDFDNILSSSSFDQENYGNAAVSINQQSRTSKQMMYKSCVGPLLPPILKNCTNVTINYNFK